MRPSNLVVFICFLALAGLAFARVPVRQSSDNGIDSSANKWKLLGRTDAQPYAANGKKATIVREAICPNQDRVNGYCHATDGSGDYMFLFQLQSIQLQPTDTFLNVTIGRLSGFVASDADRTYGVMACPIFDPTVTTNNTLELCTTDYVNLPDITLSQNASKTSATFRIQVPIPTFPVGKTEQGVGLTLFIRTHQSAYRPIMYPTVGIN